MTWNLWFLPSPLSTEMIGAYHAILPLFLSFLSFSLSWMWQATYYLAILKLCCLKNRGYICFAKWLWKSYQTARLLVYGRYAVSTDFLHIGFIWFRRKWFHLWGEMYLVPVYRPRASPGTRWWDLATELVVICGWGWRERQVCSATDQTAFL